MDDDFGVNRGESNEAEENAPLRWAPQDNNAEQRISQEADKGGEQFGGPGGEPPPHPPPPEALPSWERLEEEGFWRALFASIREILLEPANTFERMPREPALGRPLLFAVILGTAGAVITACYDLIGRALWPSGMMMYQKWLEQIGAQPEELPISPVGMMAVGTLCGIVLAPIMIVISAFLLSGIVHLLLMLFGGANHGFETTFRTISYVMGATATLAIIPFCGRPLGTIWALVCAIIGLTRSQEAEGWQAALAVLLPLLLFCCCTAGLIVFIFGPVFASQLHQM